MSDSNKCKCGRTKWTEYAMCWKCYYKYNTDTIDESETDPPQDELKEEKACFNCDHDNLFNNDEVCTSCGNGYSNWIPLIEHKAISGNESLKQKDGKFPIGLLVIDFRDALFEVTKCLAYNATHKYYPRSWQKMYNNPDVPENDLIEAMFRHLYAHLNGELIDPEDKTPHLAHLIVDALFLLTFQVWRKNGVILNGTNK